jgi:hypothetical protein
MAADLVSAIVGAAISGPLTTVFETVLSIQKLFSGEAPSHRNQSHRTFRSRAIEMEFAVGQKVVTGKGATTIREGEKDRVVSFDFLYEQFLRLQCSNQDVDIVQVGSV